MTARSSHTVVQRLSVGPVTHLRISGVIDETFAPQSFAADMVGHTIIDLGRVERISSFGVRKWIEFTGKVPHSVAGLYLIHAPPLVVDQLNMVEGFAGVAQVLSVLAPYTCPKCNEDRVRVVDLKLDAASVSAGAAPEHTCPVCQTKLEFADQPAEFFDYVRHQPSAPVDPTVGRYLRTLQPSPPSDVVSHVKLVKDDVTFLRVASVLRPDLNVRRLAAGLEGRVAYNLGNVSTVEPEAVPRLCQVLDTAAQSAQVFLWRVSPPVLTVLAAQGRKFNVGVLTLWLPAECRNCGNKLSQRIPAAAYAQSLQQNKKVGTSCQVCGGASAVPSMKECLPFLLEHVTRNPGLEDDLETLEPRALSQYLAGAAAHDVANKVENTDPNGPLGSSLKLQILRRIGQGGMAEVFLARQVGLKGFEKYVVVKKILEHFAQSPDFVEMLFAEARANARLTHSNIVQTYDVGMMDGVAYITMEYVRGPDVKKLLTMLRRAGVRLPIEHALRIVAETAAGLHYAHSYVDPTGTPHPVVHRDVSPHNILVSLDGAIKLSDFGIAKVQGETEHTRPGTFKGKIAYVSPEAVACQPLDARNDVFSLGVVLYELLTGSLPFKRESEAAVLRAIMQEPAPNPSQQNPAIPEEISAITLRALEKDPERRIQTAAQLKEELEAAMSRHRIHSTPSAVAQFFADNLREQLADFGPMLAGSGAAGAAAAALARESAAADSDFTEVHAEGIPGGAPSAAAKPVSGSGRSVPPSRPREPSVSVNSQPSLSRPDSRPRTAAAAAAAATPSYSNGSRALAPVDVRLDGLDARPPEPKTVPAAPLALAAANSGSFKAQRPESTQKRATDPSAVAAASAASAQRRRTSQRKAYARSIIGGISVGAIASLVVALLLRSSDSRLEVKGLSGDEQLYIFGVRVDPSDLRPEGPDPLMVSTARNGRLFRFGNAYRDQGIDVEVLVEARSAPGQERAPLKIRSEPAGCAVKVGEDRLDRPTPVETAIDAGRETLLTVTCPDRPAWTRWVMATPGQSIEVVAAIAPK